MTTLDASFLRAVALQAGFKPKLSVGVQGALLLIGMHKPTFTAAELPADVTGGSRHISGAATGNLVSMGLLQVVGRVKSPNPDAKGRKLDLLTIAPGKFETVKAWLRTNGFNFQPTQLTLL